MQSKIAPSVQAQTLPRAEPAPAAATQTAVKASRAPLITGAVIFAAALGLYLRTLAPSVMPGDYAEFQTAAAVLGVPHPTGYPLYIMLGKLFTVLPFGDVAYRVNLSSAVYMAGATTMLYAVAVRLLTYMGRRAHWWTAAVGAAFFAVAPTVWSMALVARSYALNALLVSSVVFALVTWRHTANPRWFYAACLLTGLSMVHHGTTYLLLPAYGLYLLLTEIERRRKANYELRITNYSPNSKLKTQNSRLLKGVLFFLLGYSPILFLVYRFLGGSPYYWGNPTTWKDFFNLLRGGPFQDQFFAFGWGAQLDRIAFGIGELSGQYTPIGIALGLVGHAVLWRSLKPEAGLLTLMMLGNFLFAMNYSLVGYLYFIPTFLIWGIFMSVGLAWLAPLTLTPVARRLGGETARAAGLIALPVLLAALALCIYALLLRFPNIDQSTQTQVRDEALALLNSAPKDATLYMDWEDVSVIRFYRMVYGMRPDITLRTGDPADWAKEVYCTLTAGQPAYVGEFAGAEPPIIKRDFSLEPAPMGWRVTAANNPARYQVPPCGTCATCR